MVHSDQRSNGYILYPPLLLLGSTFTLIRVLTSQGAAEMTREPINANAYAEAVAAADGDTVVPIKGAEATPDMVLWHDQLWLTVLYRSNAGDAIRIDFHTDDPAGTAFRFTNPATELYQRLPAEATT
jgi:hypothetical protein